MWTHAVYGTDLYHFIQWFILYSVMGWVVESIYMSFCNRKLTNRGFAFSPFCPIYAVGALSVYGMLRPLAGQYVVLYLAGAVLATTLEYITAVLMRNLFGQVWWDYTEKPFNYKGVICLESTIAWGFYDNLYVWLPAEICKLRIRQLFCSIWQRPGGSRGCDLYI